MRREEPEEELERARRMRAGGVPLPISEDDKSCQHALPRGLLVRQVGAESVSKVFDMLSGGTGYIIDISITSNIKGPFSVSSFGLELPWNDSSIQWLPDPFEVEGSDGHYRFPSADQMWFPRDQVINHRADLQSSLSRGRSLTGLLLGFGFGHIPDDVAHGRRVPAFLKITDQFARTYRSAVYLWADRSHRRFADTTRRKGSRRRLFASRDWEHCAPSE